MTRFWHTPDWREKMSKLMKERGIKPPGMKGRKHSPESIEKMRKISKNGWESFIFIGNELTEEEVLKTLCVKK